MINKILLFNIRRTRESKNIKQEYVAEQLGISPATYSKLENGKVKLTAHRLQQIADILTTSLAYLIANTNDCHIGQMTVDTLDQELALAKAQISKLQHTCTQQLEREKRLLTYVHLLEKQLNALPQ